MADYNLMTIMGRLTRAPEIKHFNSGSCKTRFSVATSDQWKAKDGTKKETSLFLDVEVWDRTAENCAQYLKKGSQVLVAGPLAEDSWEDKKTGEKRKKLYIKAETVQFLDPKSAGSAPAERSAPAPSRSTSAPTTDLRSAEELTEPGDDDIPF